MTIWTRRPSPTALPTNAEDDLGQWSRPIGRPPGFLARLRRRARRRLYVWTVLLPTALAGAYFAAIAAPQYQSEARFLVRARSNAPTGGFADMLAGAGFAHASEDAMGIRDYLASHDAVAALRRQLDLIAIYRRPEADFLARLWWEQPPAERLRDYIARMAEAELDQTSGITALRVRAFRPEDAQAIGAALIGLAEDMVNRINRRLLADGLQVAQEEVARAELRVTTAQVAMTAFRERERMPDPGRSAVLAIDNVARLEGALTQARAELAEVGRFARADNPRLLQLKNRTEGLSAQIAAERVSLGAAAAGVPQQLGDYERLSLERELARGQLASATASLERARADLQRQQVFLLRVVEPNLAEWARYPRGVLSVFTLFVGLSVAYGLAWLLVAGMREHAA